MKIALAGNPNCGKSTLFNALTGSHQKIGNWPGVTVEKKTGYFEFSGKKCEVVDLPGVYSLTAFSEDERVTCEFLLANDYDVVVNIVDVTQLERNLYLTTQLLELGKPVICVLNMMDLAEKKHIQVDEKLLQKSLGLPVVALSARKESTVGVLKSLLHKGISPSTRIVELEKLKETELFLQQSLEEQCRKEGLQSLFVARKLLEGDPKATAVALRSGFTREDIQAQRNDLSAKLGEDLDFYLASCRYQWVEEQLQQVLVRPEEKGGITEKLDKIALNKYLGFPIFLLVMYTVFWVTMVIGGAFIDFFDIAFGTIFVDGVGALLKTLGAGALLESIIAVGIGGGIQTLATFVPIIFTLFLMISFLEGTGYMARAAFVMDRLMRAIGLPGKAFIPLMVGFGCTVPAIMATRTLDSKRDRIMTVFMSPFMSCGARMPVYALFAAAFFPENAQNAVFILYFLGVFLAIFTGLLMKKTVFKEHPSTFVMELPKYHIPQGSVVLRSANLRLLSFVKKSAKVLIPIIALLGVLNSLGTDGSFGNENTNRSVLSVMGRAVSPVFEPMGVREENWPATVGLFTGLFAKEVIVGSLNSLYFQNDQAGSEPTEENEFSLVEGLKTAFASIPQNLAGVGDNLLDPFGMNVGDVSNTENVSADMGVQAGIFGTMKTYFGSPWAAFAYLIFVLLYVPCFVALSAAWKEIGQNLALIQAGYSTLLAWTLAVLFYQFFEGGSALWIVVALIALVVGIMAILKLFILSVESKKEIPEPCI